MLVRHILKQDLPTSLEDSLKLIEAYKLNPAEIHHLHCIHLIQHNKVILPENPRAYVLLVHFFTFMHLADTFIQRDLSDANSGYTVFFLYQYVCSRVVVGHGGIGTKIMDPHISF